MRLGGWTLESQEAHDGQGIWILDAGTTKPHRGFIRLAPSPVHQVLDFLHQPILPSSLLCRSNQRLADLTGRCLYCCLLFSSSIAQFLYFRVNAVRIKDIFLRDPSFVVTCRVPIAASCLLFLDKDNFPQPTLQVACVMHTSRVKQVLSPRARQD
jgi:hypothetical protein